MASVIPKRKDQIQKVAETLFREKGFASTSMRILAKNVGIEPASIYSHIHSKEEILQDICFGMADHFFIALEEAGKNEKLKPSEKLRKAIIGHIQVIIQNIDAAAVFFNDWRHLSQPKLEKFKTLRKKYEDSFKKIINEGITSGEFKKEDAKFIVLTIFSSMNWTYEWYKPDSNVTAELLGNKISNIILEGIKS